MRLRQTEDDFQDAVIELAQINGWKVAHFRPARTATGWRTPVQADGKGFPDLVLVRGRKLLFRELKSERGKLTDEQWSWIAWLKFSGADACYWRPSEWPEIEKVLMR